MTEKPAFGFSELETFQPKPKPTKTHINEVDTAGENLGFIPRDKPVERRKRRGVTKPVEQFNLRAHIEDINRFVDYAERTNKSYREVFAELVLNLPSA